MTRPRTRAKLTVHAPIDVKAEIQVVAEQLGVSESAASLALLQEAPRMRVEHQHAALLEATVERTIGASLAAHVGRLGDLTARAALDSDETRRLVIALLVRELGPDQARAMRREAHSASWQRLREPLQEPSAQRSGACLATPARA